MKTFWCYSVAFKKPGSGRLIWMDTGSKSVMEASKIARHYMVDKYPELLRKGYLEYGISKTKIKP